MDALKTYLTLPPHALAIWEGGEVTNKGALPLYSPRAKNPPEPPPVGTVVRMIGCAQGFTLATVTGYFVEGGWLGCVATPKNPPAQFVKRFGAGHPVYLFGPEMMLLPES